MYAHDLVSALSDNPRHESLVLSLLSVLACVMYFVLRRDDRVLKPIAWAAYALLLAFAVYEFATRVAGTFRHPGVWDFSAFYLFGKAGVSGHNYYLPSTFQHIFSTLQLPHLDYSGFIDEVVRVGFLYPPPTILLFTPLGYLSYHSALVVWTIFNVSFAVGSIWLLQRLCTGSSRLAGLLLAATLFFLLPAVLDTVSFSQTNFILLFLLLLMYAYPERDFSGIALAFAVFVKPYMIVFAVIFLLRRQWRILAYFLVTSLALTSATLALFGRQPFISYLFDNPAKRLPTEVFLESIKQSLHSALLRAHLITLDHPISYLVLIAPLFLAVVWYAMFLSRRRQYEAIWSVLLLIGLLLYPGTLSHYGVLLLLVVFQLLDDKGPIGISPYLSIPVIGIVYVLSKVSLFSCLCFLLIIVVARTIDLRVLHWREAPPAGAIDPAATPAGVL